MNDKTVLDCGHPESPHSEFTTGYGTDAAGKTFCYACCADNDRKQMDTGGRATMYLVKRDGQYFITNWPGSLEYRVQSFKTSWHNMAGKNGRVDVWFTDHMGKPWHAYQIGAYNQIAHCKRIKA